MFLIRGGCEPYSTPTSVLRESSKPEKTKATSLSLGSADKSIASGPIPNPVNQQDLGNKQARPDTIPYLSQEVQRWKIHEHAHGFSTDGNAILQRTIHN